MSKQLNYYVVRAEFSFAKTKAIDKLWLISELTESQVSENFSELGELFKNTIRINYKKKSSNILEKTRSCRILSFIESKQLNSTANVL